MRKKVLLFVVILFVFQCEGQNLVPNWSFETYSNCPTTFSQMEYATGWYQSYINNCCHAGVDYLNACGGPNFRVPSNYWGIHNASTGVAYQAQVTMAPSVSANYRENMYARLNSPLVPGQTYYLSMKVVRATYSQYSTNNDGISFSTDTTIQINNIAAVHSVSVISDSANWTTIAGCYMADSAYIYVAVGNFFDDSNTTYIETCPSCSRGFPEYYVDDILVEPLLLTGDTTICIGDTAKLNASGGVSYQWNTEDTTGSIWVTPLITTTYIVSIINPLCTYTASITVNVDSCISTGIEQLNALNQIKVYPNPSSGIFTIANAGAKNFSPATIEVFDVLGEKVYSAILPKTPKGALSEIDLRGKSNGVYFYRVLGEDGELIGEGKLCLSQ